MSDPAPSRPGTYAPAPSPTEMYALAPGPPGTSAPAPSPLEPILPLPAPLERQLPVALDMATAPIFYIIALNPDPQITEFQVYGFCADSMCFSCKTYDILNPPTDEHLCNNKGK